MEVQQLFNEFMAASISIRDTFSRKEWKEIMNPRIEKGMQEDRQKRGTLYSQEVSYGLAFPFFPQGIPSWPCSHFIRLTLWGVSSWSCGHFTRYKKYSSGISTFPHIGILYIIINFSMIKSFSLNYSATISIILLKVTCTTDFHSQFTVFILYPCSLIISNYFDISYL